MKKISLNIHRYNELKDSINTFLIEMYFVLMILNYYIEKSNRYFEWYIGFVFSFIAFLISIKKHKLLLKEVIFYSSLLLLHALSIYYNKNIEMSSVLQYLRYIFIAISLSRTKLNKRITRLFLLLFLTFYLHSLLSGVYVGDILKHVSVNAISEHLIVFEILYLLSLEGNTGFESLLYSLLSGIIVIWSGSRSGMIAIAVIIIASFRLNGKTSLAKLKNLVKVTPIVLVVSLFLFIKRKSNLFDIFYSKRISRIQLNQESLFQDIRFKILFEYFREAFSNLNDFIFGPSLNKLPIINLLGGNPHNSYINLYAMFGFLGFVLVLYYVIKSVVVFTKKRDYRLFLLLTILLRSFSDIVAFVGYYDSFFWYFIFEIIIIEKSKFLHLTKSQSSFKIGKSNLIRREDESTYENK